MNEFYLGRKKTIKQDRGNIWRECIYDIRECIYDIKVYKNRSASILVNGTQNQYPEKALKVTIRR